MEDYYYLFFAYNSADEKTQLLFGFLLILFCSFILVANFYFWASEKIKKNE